MLLLQANNNITVQATVQANNNINCKECNLMVGY